MLLASKHTRNISEKQVCPFWFLYITAKLESKVGKGKKKEERRKVGGWVGRQTEKRKKKTVQRNSQLQKEVGKSTAIIMDFHFSQFVFIQFLLDLHRQ